MVVVNELIMLVELWRMRRVTFRQFYTLFLRSGRIHTPVKLVESILGGFSENETDAFIKTAQGIVLTNRDPGDRACKKIIDIGRQKHGLDVAQIIGGDPYVAIHLCRVEPPTEELVRTLRPAGPGFVKFFVRFPFLRNGEASLQVLERLEYEEGGDDDDDDDDDGYAGIVRAVLECMFLAKKSDAFHPFPITSIIRDGCLREMLERIKHLGDFDQILAKLFLSGLDVGASLDDPGKAPSARVVIGLALSEGYPMDLWRVLERYKQEFPSNPLWPALLVDGLTKHQFEGMCDLVSRDGWFPVARGLAATSKEAARRFLLVCNTRQSMNLLLELYLECSRGGAEDVHLEDYSDIASVDMVIRGKYGFVGHRICRFVTDDGPTMFSIPTEGQARALQGGRGSTLAASVKYERACFLISRFADDIQLHDVFRTPGEVSAFLEYCRERISDPRALRFEGERDRVSNYVRRMSARIHLQ